jgi:hypothetical protein
MPTTVSLEARLKRSNYAEPIHKLTRITRLCDMDENGLIMTTAILATLRICQNDNSMAMLLCHVVEGYVRFCMKNIFLPTEVDRWHRFDLDKACPLLTTLVYWTSRHTSLPTIYWNTSRISIESHIHLLMKCPGYTQTLKVHLDMLRICLYEILTHHSIFGTPLASMPS